MSLAYIGDWLDHSVRCFDRGDFDWNCHWQHVVAMHFMALEIP